MENFFETLAQQTQPKEKEQTFTERVLDFIGKDYSPYGKVNQHSRIYLEHNGICYYNERFGSWIFYTQNVTVSKGSKTHEDQRLLNAYAFEMAIEYYREKFNITDVNKVIDNLDTGEDDLNKYIPRVKDKLKYL
jgi:hypothetical protein